MAFDETKPENNQRNWLLIGIAGISLVSLCLCVGLAGFALGRAAESQEPVAEVVRETVTEIVEITREVTIVPDTPTISPDDSSTTDADSGENDVSGDTVTGSAAAAATPTEQVETPAVTDEVQAPPAQTEEETPPPVYNEIEDIDLDILYEVWNIVENDFDGQLPGEEDLLYALINGSLETLDDEYTRFIEPNVAARLREDMGGSVSGIGAFVQENDEGLIEIVSPIEGQPADLIGLLPGDIIIGVDGESVIGTSFDEVLLLVRGPAGTDVTLEILREDEEETLFFTITRARFEVPVVEAEMLPENIAYVRLLEFNQLASERLEAELSLLLAEEPAGLILDLRNNPGGFLNQSIAVADMFLPESVVLLERNAQGLDQTFRADNGDLGETIPMVVLVNRGSASASEIVAGALQDNGRAVLVGETTFGKGSVQQVYTLSNGAELRVTIARWYTPENLSISENGITPDIEVEVSPEDLTIGGEEDLQLQEAVDYLLNGE